MRGDMNPSLLHFSQIPSLRHLVMRALPPQTFPTVQWLLVDRHTNSESLCR